MGFKWFRARMSMDQPRTRNPTGVPGFYRTISNFDSGIWPPPPTMVQKPRAIPIPVPPPQLPVHQHPQNPIETLSTDDTLLEYKRDSGLSEGEHEGQFTLPRASVDILREKCIDDVKKGAIKKKKGIAPRPHESMRNGATNSSDKELVI